MTRNSAENPLNPPRPYGRQLAYEISCFIKWLVDILSSDRFPSISIFNWTTIYSSTTVSGVLDQALTTPAHSKPMKLSDSHGRMMQKDPNYSNPSAKNMDELQIAKYVSFHIQQSRQDHRYACEMGSMSSISRRWH